MTQLKDDCFAYGDELTPLDRALDLLADRVGRVVGTETVPLAEALFRTIAEDVVAPRDVPPHDNSAVDGYAVFFDDLDADDETRLPVTARIAAGHPLDRPARRGEALRIFTGAPLPQGPDTVFMQEDCEVDGDTVVLKPGIKRGANRRFRAEDVREGAVIVADGTFLRPQEIGVAASVGRHSLCVYEPLRVAVFSTGDEIRDPSGDAPPGCVFDANRFTIMGLLKALGCRVTDLGILPDDLDAIRGALAGAAAGHHLLITSGGVSLGEEDHVKAAVQALGSLHFWRVAIKPGRPIALGQVGETAFVGLPGNPVAAMVTFMRIARPMVLMLSGRRDVEPRFFRVAAGFDFRKKKGRREWLRARLERGPAGELVAQQHPATGSGVLTSMVESDGLIELGEDTGPFEAGTAVDFLPFNEVSQ
ncbi:MAG: molybdopterin molybdotransferase MoeA [Hyphomicrobiales bacterium]|nr:molybdopterin molybdotransferase MoeA [Hyphomicrobiales bacterium]MCP5372309.1 molybdopterin molybdotransferase MoeA [Hyphomicrobiales bacterium]